MHRELNNMIKPIINNKDIEMATLLISHNIYNVDLLSMCTLYGNANIINYVLYTIKYEEMKNVNIFNSFIEDYINKASNLYNSLSEKKKDLLLRRVNATLKYMSKYREENLDNYKLIL